MTDLKLHIAGYKYSGWTSIRVTKSMDQLAHSFDLSLTDRWVVEEADLPLEVGQRCRISHDNVGILTGWIDSVITDYTSDGMRITVSGRSLSGDLVDCAATHSGGQWRGSGLLKIAQDLCSPFGLSAYTNTDLGGAFRIFELQDGETVFQALERAARRRGVLLQTRPDGNIVFERVGSTKVKTKLVYGRNILEGSKRTSWQDRFSTYTVKAQAQGTDTFFGSSAAALKMVSTDSGVTRYRPTIISADDEDSGEELQKRANWERNVRAGRAAKLDYLVQGWSHTGGLWQPNKLVCIEDRVLRVDDEVLISEVTFERNENSGTVTRLSLVRKEGYDIQPLPPPKQKTGALE
ncbi:MAG: hypothetical protein PVJ86_01485 [Phycisphaerales bacterium]